MTQYKTMEDAGRRGNKLTLKKAARIIAGKFATADELEAARAKLTNTKTKKGAK